MPTRFSDAALRQYALWGMGVNKFAYDASISGDKMQAYPLRVPQEWIIRNGHRARYTGAVVLEETPMSNVGNIVLGIVIGWIAKGLM